jgi:trk system potassium uptake protein TrkA
MKVLICGGGRITRELLKRLGDSWEITMVEKNPDHLDRLTDLYPFLKHTVHGDASSPVVLEEANLASQDFMLAMTDNDPVNLAAVRFAGEKGVPHILARVNDADQYQKQFTELGVQTLIVNLMIAKTICHYLEEPRVRSTPVSQGRVEVLEIPVDQKSWAVGMPASPLGQGGWRVGAIIRENDLLFPDPRTTVQAGDRLMVLADPSAFKEVSHLFDSGTMRFPQSYGRELLLVLPDKKELDPNPLLAESYHLVQNTGLVRMSVICGYENGALSERWQDLDHGEGVELTLEQTEDVWDRVYEIASERSVGLVASPPLEGSFLSSLIRPRLITLAHSLTSPLFITRQTQPYEKILVPFNATAMAERAVEVAADLARAQGSEVTVVVVQGDEFLHGDEDECWANDMFAQVRKLGHKFKIAFKEELRQGNPVKEITGLTQKHDLLVIGSTTRDAGLFSPPVGELLAMRAACSVLILTA